MVSIIETSIGKKFGKLTVNRFIEYRQTPSKANVPMVEAECECGALKVVSLWDVRSGKTKTCGFNHPHYEDRSMPAFNQIYRHSYRGRAEKAGVGFELTPDEFRSLTQMPCHYCGARPNSFSYRGLRGTINSGKGTSQYIYNGLDRIDSAVGYTLTNVVPCCGICNHAKHTMSYTDFTAWLDRIAEFRSK